MIYLSDAAALKIKELFVEKELSENSAVRFIVKGGGCSGFTLDVKIEPPSRYDLARRTDSKFVDKGVRILVDKKSSLFIDNMQVDFVRENFGHKFVYDNPNASGWCGCGESFAI